MLLEKAPSCFELIASSTIMAFLIKNCGQIDVTANLGNKPKVKVDTRFDSACVDRMLTSLDEHLKTRLSKLNEQ